MSKSDAVAVARELLAAKRPMPLPHADTVRAICTALIAESERAKRYERALQRIAIMDDADCKHADDATWMRRLARGALSPGAALAAPLSKETP